MSGHSTVNIVEEMGYNHYIDTKALTKVVNKDGLGSNKK
jgi:hypothetical protein